MQFSYRDLLSNVCVFIFLTTCAAENTNTTCSASSHNETCEFTINNISNDGVLINLDKPRKTLKCISCEMKILTGINSTYSSLVEIIDFSQSHIKTIQNARHSEFENVRIFNLSHNRIDDLVINENGLLASCKNLTKLDLSHNYIQKIASKNGLNLLSNQISDLDLSHNNISELQLECFKTMKQLRKLKLNNNKIPLITSVFDNLESLSHLDLSFNVIASIDDNIFQNVPLKELDLSNNFLGRLNSNIFLNTPSMQANLQVLKLSNNTIKQILSELPRGLQTLDLSINELDDINATTLSRFKDLQHLNLRQSGLRTGNSSTFAAQSHLRSLDISYNNLTRIDFNITLPPYINLTDLCLDGNALTALDADHVFKLFPNLKKIGISHNAWSCTYLSILFKRLNTSGIEVNVKRPDGDQISDDGCNIAKEIDEGFQFNVVDSITVNASLISIGIMGIIIVILFVISIFLLFKEICANTPVVTAPTQ